MIRITDSVFIQNALKKLSQHDYLANILLEYDKEDKKVCEAVENLSLETSKQVMQEAQKLSALFERVSQSFSGKLGTFTKSPKSFNELVSLYLLNNFRMLSPSKETFPFYERLEKLNKMDGSPLMRVSILLRATKILEELDDDGKKILLDLMEAGKDDGFNQVIHMVYYGLFEHKYVIPLKEVEESSKTIRALLLDEHFLPDDIIKNICVSKELSNVSEPGILAVMLKTIFMPVLEDDMDSFDSRDVISKVFNNDITDLDSKAEFLDLSDYVKIIEGYFLGTVSIKELDSFLHDVFTGNKVLPKRKDGTYGAI